MEPKHTLFLYDCRPMKFACMDILDRIDQGEPLDPGEVKADILALAETVPGLDAEKFAHHIFRLAETRNIERARRLVSKLEDLTFKPWVAPAKRLTVFLVKGSLIFGLIYLAVRLAL